MLRARLFGGLAVEIDGRAVADVPGMKPRALLAYLLTRPGLQSRARVAGVFWPDVLDTSARASLRSALWSVRAALEAVGGGEYLVSDRAGAGIAPDLPRWIDAEEAERLLAGGDRTSLERAVELAARPFLPEVADDWAIEAQDAWRERLVGALERLAALAEAEGDMAAAIEWTRRALRHDRLREAGHRALIRRLADAGERAQAMAAYRRCRDVMAAELGIAPSAETRALAEGLRSGAAPAAAPADAVPAPAAPPQPPAPVAAPSRPPLRGREAELAALRDALAAATAGRGGVAAIEGPAGIGKSRLAAELLDEAAAAGARTVSGAALDLEGGPPYAAWSEGLRGLIRATPAPPAEARWPADLALLCPAVESAWRREAAAATTPDLERLRIFDAVVEAIAWSARGAPTVVLLEDMHRADPASLALLGHAGRRLGDLRALIVLTRRPSAEGDVERALEAVRRQDGAPAEIALGPLDEGAIAAIVGDAASGLGGEGVARVAEAAGGNPLIAREAARAAAAGLAPEEGLRGSVRASLAGLPGAGRDLVALAAAAGRPLSPGEAGEILGAEPAAHARDVAAEAGLLLSRGDGRLAFAHDLVARACEAELAPERLGWAHRSLADALAGRPAGRAAELARHLRLAGRGPRAVPYLAAAAAEARRLGALDEAAGFLVEGIALAPEPDAEAELWLGLADVQAWRGDREGLDAAFGRARALLEAAGEPAALAAAWAARGRWLRTSICYPRESLDAYRTALGLLERGQVEAPEVEVLARAGAAWAESVAGDPRRAEAAIAALEARPDAAGDPVLAAELALDRTMALIRAGRLAEADEQGLRALAAAQRAGRPELGSVALGNIAAAAAARGDFARCLELVERALPEERVGPGLAVHILAARAYALSRLGRHAEAVEAARAQEDLAGRVGAPDLLATAAFDLGCTLLAAGEPGAAAERLGAALATGDAHFSRPLARLLRAQALAAVGDADAAAGELGRFPFEPVGAGDLPETLLGRLPRTQALVALAGGEPERALAHLDEAERVWRRRLASAPEGDVFAAAVADLGRPPVAGLVEPAVELGLTLADRAGVLAALGRPDDARAAAREAAALADETGFEGYRERVVTDARVH
jgi:DNA-binding SARP family transcriptional activator